MKLLIVTFHFRDIMMHVLQRSYILDSPCLGPEEEWSENLQK